MNVQMPNADVPIEWMTIGVTSNPDTIAAAYTAYTPRALRRRSRTLDGGDDVEVGDQRSRHGVAQQRTACLECGAELVEDPDRRTCEHGAAQRDLDVGAEQHCERRGRARRGLDGE